MELRVKKIKIEGNKFTMNCDDNTIVVEKSRFGDWLDIEFEEEMEQVMEHYKSDQLLEYIDKRDALEKISHLELLHYIEEDETLMKGLEEILLRRKRFLKLSRIVK